MTGRERICVIEDDSDISRIITRSLAEYRYDVETCRTGAEALRRLKSQPADLCILDLGLPDTDGMGLVKTLAGDMGMAVLILTGRMDLSDRVVGLELGADDYVLKPFEPRELIARVRSILRRAGRGAHDLADPAGRTVRFAGFAFQSDRLELVAPDGSSQALSAAEARLLVTLLRAPNRILSRDQLLSDAADGPLDRSIDVRISRLRRKIEIDPREPEIIKTIYGAGYLLVADVVWD